MEKMKFEKAIEKLEKIVDELESGDLALEDALERYEEGIKLSKFCSKKLEETQKKVEILTKKANGDFDTEPFAVTDEEPSSKKSHARGKTKGKTRLQKDNPVADEDLLFS